MRLLIEVGANLEAHDCHFGTPLHVACAREHLDCVKVLLNAGRPVSASGTSGFIPAAAWCGRVLFTPVLEELCLLAVLFSAGVCVYACYSVQVGPVPPRPARCRCFVYLHCALAESWAVDSHRPGWKLALPLAS